VQASKRHGPSNIQQIQLKENTTHYPTSKIITHDFCWGFKLTSKAVQAHETI
jgi:hypothetical protein